MLTGILKDFVIFLIGMAVIIKSAAVLTEGAEGIARVFRIPRIIVGLTIVSLATTAPELAVSAMSSYMGVGGMAVGNAMGSCLANICLILALAAIIRPIGFQRRTIRQELPFLLALIIILSFFVLDNRLTFLDGLILCFIQVGFFIYIVVRELGSRLDAKETGSSKDTLAKPVLKFLLGAVCVVVSARYGIIPSGINIARFFGMPEIVIGLSMVAIGTSLPELVTAVIASLKGMGDLAVGNVIGANIMNILWVLGFSSIINPLEIDIQTKMVTIPIVFGITLLMFIFSRTQFQLSRAEGFVLFAIYICYIFYIFKFAYA